MGLDKPGIKRRTSLKQTALAGLSALSGTSLPRFAWSASKERLMILSSIGLDTLHPYAHSSGPQYGIWQHMIEPLVEINYARKDYYGVLAESDRKSTRLNSSHLGISYAVFCLKKKKKQASKEASAVSS